jgi:FeS assembly SUF system regulator
MLRITKLADYGTVIMNSLAREPDQLFSTSEIAKKVHIPQTTVSKILKILVAASLVLSVRGSGGGYRLARIPSEITVADVITALDGRPALTECNIYEKKCSQDAVCSIRDNWRLINAVVMNALQSLTLADMAKPLNIPALFTQGISAGLINTMV